MKVDSYKFGEIVIDREKYTNDVIVFKDHIMEWWRKEGHLLQVEDITKVIKEKPDVLIIGTGAYGAMKVDDKVEEEMKNKGIKLIKKKSKEACEEFNRTKENAILAIHLTC